MMSFGGREGRNQTSELLNQDAAIESEAFMAPTMTYVDVAEGQEGRLRSTC